MESTIHLISALTLQFALRLMAMCWCPPQRVMRRLAQPQFTCCAPWNAITRKRNQSAINSFRVVGTRCTTKEVRTLRFVAAQTDQTCLSLTAMTAQFGLLHPQANHTWFPLRTGGKPCMSFQIAYVRSTIIHSQKLQQMVQIPPDSLS